MADIQRPCALPPLSLRTAYTQKGLGIGAGAFLGQVLFGPYGAMGLAYVGWMLGNRVAIREEKLFLESCERP